MGLSFCRRACEALGGTITCESVPGVRTTFTIRLPEPGAPADPTLNGPPALPALSRRVGRSHIQFAVDGRISSYALTRSMMPGGNRRIRLSEPANTIC